MNIELTEMETKFLKQYAKVFKKERDLDATRDPIVVVEDIVELVAEDGYGDKTIYALDEETFNSVVELKQALNKYGYYSEHEVTDICNELEEKGYSEHSEIQKYSVHITYRPIAYFLTRTEADRYVQYQSHNLRKPRVYTRSCGYANSGDLQCLYQLLLRMGRQLNKSDTA